MALVPEDDTGLSTADTYVDLATLKAYAAARQIDLAGTYDDPTLEAALRAAFTYVNANWVYKSVPKVNDQAGEFPRVDLSDGAGRVFNVVPKRVKDAQCEAAIFSAQGNDLFVVAARGGQVASETVGPISTTYVAGAPAETLFASVARLLHPFTRDPNNPRRPFPGYDAPDPNDPNPLQTFTLGMDDNISGIG